MADNFARDPLGSPVMRDPVGALRRALGLDTEEVQLDPRTGKAIPRVRAPDPAATAVHTEVAGSRGAQPGMRAHGMDPKFAGLQAESAMTSPVQPSPSVQIHTAQMETPLSGFDLGSMSPERRKEVVQAAKASLSSPAFWQMSQEERDAVIRLLRELGEV